MSKRTVLTLAASAAVLAAGLFSLQCRRKGPADELLQAINRAPLGIAISCPRENVTTRPEGARTRIVLKDPAVVFDPAVYKGTVLEAGIKPMPVTIRELTFLFSAREKYAEIVSMKGFRFGPVGRQFSQAGPTDKGMKTRISCGQADFHNLIISPLLTYSGHDALELLGAMLRGLKDVSSTGNSINYLIRMPVSDAKELSLFLTIGGIESRSRFDPEFVLGFYTQETPPDLFTRALRAGRPLLDARVKLNDLSFNFFTRGREIDGMIEPGSRSETKCGTLAEATLVYGMKPNDARTAFTFSADGQMRELRLSLPSDRLLEKLLYIPEIGSRFGVENLKPGLIQAYLEMVKTVSRLERAEKGREDEAARQQKMAMAGMKVVPEFMNSKPLFTFSLAPLRLAWGEMSGSASFQVPGLAGPVGSARAEVRRVFAMLKRLREEYGVSAEAINGIRSRIRKLLVIDGNGDGSMTFEMKPELPGRYILNGKTVTIRSGT